MTDDGLPKPRAAPAPPPTPSGTFGGQVNSTTGGGRPAGLIVNWMQYGGPAGVTFEATGALPVVDGQATTTVRFAEPETYQLVASASDRAMTTRVPVTVTVAAAAK